MNTADAREQRGTSPFWMFSSRMNLRDKIPIPKRTRTVGYGQADWLLVCGKASGLSSSSALIGVRSYVRPHLTPTKVSTAGGYSQCRATRPSNAGGIGGHALYFLRFRPGL